VVADFLLYWFFNLLFGGEPAVAKASDPSAIEGIVS
jgi:hypothetical protein